MGGFDGGRDQEHSCVGSVESGGEIELAEKCAKALRGVGRDGGGSWWSRGVGESVGILLAVRGQVAEALDFVGRQAARAWGRVKVWFRGRVFLTGCKS